MSRKKSLKKGHSWGQKYRSNQKKRIAQGWSRLRRGLSLVSWVRGEEEGAGWGEGNAAWRADILPIHMHTVFVYPSPQSSLTALVSHNLSGQCRCILVCTPHPWLRFTMIWASDCSKKDQGVGPWGRKDGWQDNQDLGMHVNSCLRGQNNSFMGTRAKRVWVRGNRSVGRDCP